MRHRGPPADAWSRRDCWRDCRSCRKAIGGWYTPRCIDACPLRSPEPRAELLPRCAWTRCRPLGLRSVDRSLQPCSQNRTATQIFMAMRLEPMAARAAHLHSATALLLSARALCGTIGVSVAPRRHARGHTTARQCCSAADRRSVAAGSGGATWDRVLFISPVCAEWPQRRRML